MVHTDHFSGNHRNLRHPPANNTDDFSYACTPIPDADNKDATSDHAISPMRIRTRGFRPGIGNTSIGHCPVETFVRGAELKIAVVQTRLFQTPSLVSSEGNPLGLRQSS